MMVFVGGRLYDSRRDVIGIVLTPHDKENIAKMHPDATIYSEFVPKGQGTEPGLREFDPACVERLLTKIKERTSDVTNPVAGTVAWADEGEEKA